MKHSQEWTKKIKLYHLVVVGRVNKFLLTKKNVNIAEIGCGWGVVGKALQECGYDYIGFDVNGPKIHKCKEMNVKCIQANIKDVPLGEKSVDCVVCMETLEHLDEETYGQGLKELDRILKPQGLLIITVPEGPDALKSKKHKRKVSLDELKTAFSKYTILENSITYGRESSKNADTDRAMLLVMRKIG
ncbi:MAG: class I SAM-dependent methyltransferase [Candidatus Heimdallarchaeaceae archaeon]